MKNKKYLYLLYKQNYSDMGVLGVYNQLNKAKADGYNIFKNLLKEKGEEMNDGLCVRIDKIPYNAYQDALDKECIYVVKKGYEPNEILEGSY